MRNVGLWCGVATAFVLALCSGRAEAHDHAGEPGVYSPATGGPRLGFPADVVLSRTLAGVPRKPGKMQTLLDTAFEGPRERDIRRRASTPARPQRGIVHRGGRVIGGAQGPVAAGLTTGATAGEPTMGVTSDGSLFYVGIEFDAPYPKSIVQRSRDGGKSWQELDVLLPGTVDDARTLDPFLYVDKRTDRVINADLFGLACSAISSSDDGGETFQASTICQHADHQNLFAGPAPSGDDQPSGYENILYYCSVDGGVLGQFGTMTACSRSLDGGGTWQRTASPAFVEDPSQAEGDLGIPGHCTGATGHGTVAPNGTVYLPRGYCGQPYVAISKDEGDTWTRVQVADLGMAVGPGGTLEHEANVAVDANGTVYYTWQAEDRFPYLVVSRDGGSTWGKPVRVSPPGVMEAWAPMVDVGEPGRVAVIYVGTTNSPGPPFCVRVISPQECENADGSPGRPATDWENTRWTGYMTVSVDATSPNPTFHTAQVGTYEDPLTVGTCGVFRCQQQYDFLDVVVGPDGTPWASFVDGCAPVGDKPPDCVALGTGLVGHLTGAPPLVGPLPTVPAPATTPTASRTRSCAGGRITLRLRRSLRSARVSVGKRRFEVRRRRGRLVASAPAFGLRRGVVKVKVVGKTRTGRRVKFTRRVRACR